LDKANTTSGSRGILLRRPLLNQLLVRFLRCGGAEQRGCCGRGCELTTGHKRQGQCGPYRGKRTGTENTGLGKKPTTTHIGFICPPTRLCGLSHFTSVLRSKPRVLQGLADHSGEIDDCTGNSLPAHLGKGATGPNAQVAGDFLIGPLDGAAVLPHQVLIRQVTELRWCLLAKIGEAVDRHDYLSLS
jgi:hypothetical protein